MAVPEFWGNPITTRSRVVLEVASELVGQYNKNWQAKVLVKVQGEPEWETSFSGSSTIEGIEAVVKRESTLAITNPTAVLALAYRGIRPFTAPQPVRTIAVLPTNDQFVFAVRSDTGLRTLEDIAAKKFPLRLSVRAIPDHSVHIMLDHIMAAAGFSVADLQAWGGFVRREGSIPWKGTSRFQGLLDGTVDAIFEEAAEAWLREAVDAGMTILPVAEETAQELEGIGFRRAILHKDRFANLPQDILTIDFSGWPICVHADAPDALVTAICSALEKRKEAIPWEGLGPLPVERLCREAPETPQDVPLHAGAERYWREQGYLT
jgi:TRAP-type uncharacterized transport system substrate-binding protein